MVAILSRAMSDNSATLIIKYSLSYKGLVGNVLYMTSEFHRPPRMVSTFYRITAQELLAGRRKGF